MDSPDGLLDLLGAGQGSAAEARKALLQRGVAALAVVGLPGWLRQRCVALRWPAPALYVLLVRRA